MFDYQIKLWRLKEKVKAYGKIDQSLVDYYLVLKHFRQTWPFLKSKLRYSVSNFKIMKLNFFFFFFFKFLT